MRGRPAFTEDSWWTLLSSCRVLIAKNKTCSCILVSGEWKTNDSYILRWSAFSFRTCCWFSGFSILVSRTAVLYGVCPHLLCLCFSILAMLQDHCESLTQVEYLAVCRALCWPLEMQAVSRLCTGTLSLLPRSLSSLFQLLEQKHCRLSGLNSSSFSQFWRLEVQDQSVSIVGLVGL